jgi:glycosyltransferase involved in cell wall biosynthesis
MPTRVLHVTLAHAPHDVRVFEKECVGLAAHGYEVHLLVPGARDGAYRGVVLHRLPIAGSGSRLFRIAYRWTKAFQLARRLTAQVHHLHDIELIPVGLALKLTGAIVVFDAHEDAPVEARSLNRRNPLWGSLLALIWRSFLAVARHAFDGFVAATPHIADALRAPDTAIVRNFPRLDLFAAAGESAPPYLARAASVIYVGTISELRGLEPMLDAVARLPPSCAAELTMVGRFAAPQAEAAARRHPWWGRVRYLGELPWQGVVDALQHARIGLVLLHPTPEYEVSLPVKLFEYMAAGIPVIASDFPLWREIVTAAGCGILVDPLDPAAIARAIEALLADGKRAAAMGEAGRRAAFARYGWDSQETVLLGLYERLAGPAIGRGEPRRRSGPASPPTDRGASAG